MENTELTYGQKAVGLTFNPGGSEQVDAIKKGFSLLIDLLDEVRKSSESSEVKRMCSLSISEAQVAQMWAVKAVTWKD